MSNVKDITGNKYGYLTALSLSGKAKNGVTVWECQCDCGNTINARSDLLRAGRIKSCGCFRKTTKQWGNFKHGLSKSRLYEIWSDMKQRCCNPNTRNYNIYGGRGIKICEKWLGENGFSNFYQWAIDNGWDESKSRYEQSIDRIDVNGNYEPSNCRFISYQEQANNTRSNRIIHYNGTKYTLAELSRIAGLSQPTLRRRLFDLHWDIEKAVKNPLMKQHKMSNAEKRKRSREYYFKNKDKIIEKQRIRRKNKKIMQEASHE
jgi:hypothetical protein